MKKWDAIYHQAKEMLLNILSDGKPHYIPPKILVEYQGRQYYQNVYTILHLELGARGIEDRLNVWQI